MSYEFRLQDPGEGIHEAEIIEIKVADGDKVKEGDDVLVVETDKAAIDIPSPVAGTISEIKISQGDIVEVGDVLMVIAADGSDGTEAEGAKAKGKEQEAHDSPQSRRSSESDGRDKGVSSEGDAESPEPRSDAESTGKVEANEEDPEKDVLATPAVRGMAREQGIDLATIGGSGENGRILEEDLQRAGDMRSRAAEEQEAAQPGTEEGGVRHEKLRSIRRTTARRMAKAWKEIPQVIHYETVDIHELEKLRRHHQAEVEKEGGKLTLTPFLLKALASALGKHPRFNATFNPDDDDIAIYEAVNIGVALDSENGLIVPVM